MTDDYWGPVDQAVFEEWMHRVFPVEMRRVPGAWGQLHCLFDDPLGTLRLYELS